MLVVIANLSKSKRSDEVVQIAKDRYTTKILKHASFAFFKIVVIIDILIVQKEFYLVLYRL